VRIYLCVGSVWWLVRPLVWYYGGLCWSWMAGRCVVRCGGLDSEWSPLCEFYCQMNKKTPWRHKATLLTVGLLRLLRCLSSAQPYCLRRSRSISSIRLECSISAFDRGHAVSRCSTYEFILRHCSRRRLNKCREDGKTARRTTRDPGAPRAIHPHHPREKTAAVSPKD